MALTKDEVMQKLTELGTVEDAAERRNLITALCDDVKSVYETNETLTASNTKYEEQNKKLQEYNMQLFLRVGGQQKKPEDGEHSQTQELKYENLFDEKGELK